MEERMIGMKMKKRRIQLNLKVKEVAKEIGVSESTYRDWENGRKIQGEPYILISKALKMNIADLLSIERNSFSEIQTQLIMIENCVKNIRESVIKI